MPDVSFIQKLNTPNPVQDIVDETGGLLVSGSVRLAERVMLELFTEQGSLSYAPLRGTPFLTLIKRGARTELDVLSFFAASRQVLKNNLQREELPTDPAAERYVDAVVDQLLVAPGVVQMTLSVRSRAGLTTSVVLPVLVFQG